jgi:dolichol-phosphate mannosyltransferase
MVQTERVTSSPREGAERGPRPRALVIIPTYNEAENVGELIPAVLGQPARAEIHVLVVDDGSPDGTGDLVEALARSQDRVYLLRRSGKLGLGTAYVAGFRFALERGFDFVFEMDADFSHDPAALPSFLDAIENGDVVLGSRYLTGVTVVNWPLRRLILSYGANAYTRWVTGMPFRDATGGFKCFRRRAIEALDLDRIRTNGYAFQIETSFVLWRKGFRVTEIPIIFMDRRVGVSKMSRRIVWEAVWMVWRLRILALLGRIR